MKITTNFITLLGIVLLLISIVEETNYLLFSIVTILISVIIQLLIYYKKYQVTPYLLVCFINLLILIQGTIGASAYLFTTLGLILILCISVLNLKFMNILFLIDIIWIIVLIIIQKFAIIQIFHPDSNIALVNNVTVLIPSIIIAYLIARIIDSVYLKTIRRQKDQAESLKIIQKKLYTQDKIQSIQVLAGGIAHDFNNLLTIIIGNLSLADLEENLSKEFAESVKEIKTATQQAKILTDQLLTFSKGHIPTKEKISDIVDLVEETTRFTLHGRNSKYVINESISVIPEELYPIHGDRGQIKQIIQNLIMNADEAMPNGGIIKINIHNIDLDFANEHQLPEGKYMRIDVADSGTGISLLNSSKIFEPFFTTKQNGNGIGLSVSYRIAHQHDGVLLFKGQEGGRTIFSLILPKYSTQFESPENWKLV